MDRPDKDKISFDTFIKSDKCLPEESNSSKNVFESSKPRHNLSALVLLFIAVISVLGCILYKNHALIKSNSNFIASGTDINDYMSQFSLQYKNGKVNINTANLESLCTLKFIGESKALEIIAYRTVNGNFKCISEIKNVKGIGDVTFEKIKDYICV